MDFTALWLTLQIAGTSTGLSILVGIPIAFALAKFHFPGRNLVSSFILVPMLLPPSVLGFYLLQLVGRQSIIGSSLESLLSFTFVFHWSGAVLAAFITSTPFLIRTAQVGFESVNKRYEDAARTLGKSEFAVFRTITIPLAWKMLLAGVALALARAMGEFGATLMVAGNIPGKTQTMSIAIYDAVQTNRLHDAQVLSLALTFVTIGILVAISTFDRSSKS